MNEEEVVVATVKWKHPRQTRQFVKLLVDLPTASISVAQEPSGTYGFALAELLRKSDLSVFRVSPQRVHDYAEVYDGVPSYHDAKAAAIIAKLHLTGVSRVDDKKSDSSRAIAAKIRMMEIFRSQVQRNTNRLEAILAQYWPEATEYLALDSATLLSVLQKFGSPGAIAQHEKVARQLMEETGGNLLKPAKKEQVLLSAKSSVGVEPIAAEIVLIKALVSEIKRNIQDLRQAKTEAKKLGKKTKAVSSISPTVGEITATVLVSELGEPTEYSSAASYLKGATDFRVGERHHFTATASTLEVARVAGYRSSPPQ